MFSRKFSFWFPWLTLSPCPWHFDLSPDHHERLDGAASEHLNGSDILQSGNTREKNFESTTNFESTRVLQDYMLVFYFMVRVSGGEDNKNRLFTYLTSL